MPTRFRLVYLDISIMRDLILELFNQKEVQAGIELAKVYLKQNPSDTEMANTLAGALYLQNKFEEATYITEKLVELSPDDGLKFNLAKCYHSLEKMEKAEKLVRELYEKNKDNKEYALELSAYLSMLGRYDEAEEILKTLELDNRVKFNLGWHEMRKKNFLKGFEFRSFGSFENAWGSEYKLDISKEKRYRKGESINDKIVLLLNEGGLGDEIIFARFAQIIKARGAKKIIMSCDKSLVDIFNRIPEIDLALPYDEAKKIDYDFYIPMMNAPNLLELNSPNENIKFPYIFPKKELVEKWEKKLNNIAKGKLKIGIRWAGNLEFEAGQFKTMDVNLLVKLNKYGQLFSLQKGSRSKQLPHNFDVYDLKDELTSWDETLAIISNLDLVVSSCTSIVHMAGAMNIPCLVLTSIIPYFTWAVQERTTDWYSSVKLFRQKKLGDWSAPFIELEDYIKNEI